MANAYLIYCRPGFEKEAAAELQHHAERHGWNGYAKGKSDSAYVVFCGEDLPETGPYAPRWDDLVFARQLVILPESEALALDPQDRITPLVARLAGQTFRDLVLESPDTNEGNSLSGFFKAFGNTLKSVLDKRGILRKKATRTLHLFFLDSATVYLGYSTPENASPWPQGIPRLKFPREAPSRSTLKLEEAFLTFLSESERHEWLREGLTAVDLGAAPGGWTYQLVKRGLQVTAIDNGPMDRNLMQSGQVEHLKVDGFHYRPPRKVTWLVCDMIESPAKVAHTIAGWIADGDAQRAIFNLKLPMKKRFEELLHCQEVMDDLLRQKQVKYRLQIKQLYHDREEVTAYLIRETGPA
ncbi:23S rRNA (cytidine2498-2'-O)-methyltransferase [Fluviicoccus keumensis]|uniref:Ribosomal RNA large subunit methyltransferase M n=1 Tax=Fluviicoccus keumensis TaxID=1435465 RepID=A0A4Q7YEE2_9GAMM|nr:23S rRNA (cytidine(2498)-2'-O)-methyltransferase RlmM [Fluviicoccus keumensis]RZU35348.1 23S rRNA (cytidine2498-2'-O)-methyltransferase [Fluviicoccus keumensis]